MPITDWAVSQLAGHNNRVNPRLDPAVTGPFVLSLYVGFPHNEALKLEGDRAEIVVGGRSAVVRSMPTGVRVEVGGFETHGEAETFIGPVGTALYWWALQSAIGITVRRRVADVWVYRPPIPAPDCDSTAFMAPILRATMQHKDWDCVDGIVDGADTVVYPEGTRLVFSTMSLEASVGRSIEVFAQRINEAFQQEVITSAVSDDRLQLALELYASACREVGSQARLFGLISCLEALLDETSRPSHVRHLLDHFVQSAQQHRDEASEERGSDYERLEAYLRNGWRESVGYRARALVNRSLGPESGLGSVEEVWSKVRDAQSIRSGLIHGGKKRTKKTAEQSCVELSEILREVLRSRLLSKDPANRQVTS